MCKTFLINYFKIFKFQEVIVMLRVFIIIYSSIIISSTANECSKLFIEDIKMEPRIVYNRQPKDIMEDAILPTVSQF